VPGVPRLPTGAPARRDPRLWAVVRQCDHDNHKQKETTKRRPRPSPNPRAAEGEEGGGYSVHRSHRARHARCSRVRVAPVARKLPVVGRVNRKWPKLRPNAPPSASLSLVLHPIAGGGGSDANRSTNFTQQARRHTRSVGQRNRGLESGGLATTKCVASACREDFSLLIANSGLHTQSSLTSAAPGRNIEPSQPCEKTLVH
jgi:hypothetical protein